MLVLRAYGLIEYRAEFQMQIYIRTFRTLRCPRYITLAEIDGIKILNAGALLR